MHPRRQLFTNSGALMAAGLFAASCGSDGEGSTAAERDGAAPLVNGECITNSDCVAQHEAHWICRKPDRTCISLLAPQCDFVRGDDAADDAVYLGVLSPDLGSGQLFGAADLVREDFLRTMGGLPLAGEASPRPLVIVGCGFPQDGDPLPAARHLVETVRVPAIMGPASSTDTILVAQNLTIPRGVLLVSPTAQSDAISDLADNDLVFRTGPSTRAVGPQIAAVVRDLETKLRAERTLTRIKVAMVAARDAYGLAVSSAATEALRFNGGLDAAQNEQSGSFSLVTYNPLQEGFERDVARRIADFAPDVVIMLTAVEARPLRAIEELWPVQVGSAAPYYVTDGGGGTSVDYRKLVAESPDALRTRIRIVGGLDRQRPSFQRYFTRIDEQFGPSSVLLAAVSMYDAAYALAYGMIAADGPLDGRSIARGLRRLVGPGPLIQVFPDQSPEAVQTLAQGHNIDLDGASGALDFDAKGDVPTDAEVDCLVRTDDGRVVTTFSGQTYRFATNELAGSFSQCD